MVVTVTQILGLVAALAAAIGGVIYIARMAHKLVDVLEALSAVVRRELTPNGGSSMKDNLGALRRDVHDVKVLATDHSERLDQVESATALTARLVHEHIKRTERAERAI